MQISAGLNRIGEKHRALVAPVSKSPLQNPHEEILRAAAACFMERGYSASSIDDVARRLGATKGRIYHHYPSKADLFFDVYRMGMDLNFAAVGEVFHTDLPCFDKLFGMCRAHVMMMITEQAFQRAVWEGVSLHVNSATTPEQRVVLERLLKRRADYDQLFRTVMEECRRDGMLNYGNQSIAVSTLFAAMGGPVFWYKPRPEETKDQLENIVDQVVRFAMRGLGASERTAA
jgi:AcrR family transcriptional regulator